MFEIRVGLIEFKAAYSMGVSGENIFSEPLVQVLCQHAKVIVLRFSSPLNIVCLSNPSFNKRRATNAWLVQWQYKDCYAPRPDGT